MRTRDLERHLVSHGCVLNRQGGRHAIWRNPATGRRAPVSRHRDIPRTTANNVCRILDVPKL